MKKLLAIMAGALLALSMSMFTSCDDANDDVPSQVEYINIKSIKYVSKTDITGKNVFFLSNDLPGNEWNGTTPNYATASEKTAEYTFNPVWKCASDNLDIQVVAGATVGATGDPFWNCKVVADEGTSKIKNKWDCKTYTLVITQGETDKKATSELKAAE